MFWRKPAPAPDANPAKPSLAANFPPRDAAGRAALLQIIRETPVAHGPWQSFKKLFKDIEAQPQADTQLLAAMLQRVDALPMRLPSMRGNVWDDVPTGAPRARWDGAGHRLVVRDAAGHEGVMPFGGYGQVVQMGKLAVVVSGDYNETQLSFVDVSDATQPTLVAGQDLKNVNAWNALAFAARSDKFLILCFQLSNPYNNVRLMIFDVSQPSAPRLTSSLMLGVSYTFQAAFDGTRLVFFGGNWNRTQLKVVDLSDIAKPKLGGEVNLGNLGWGSSRLAASNGFAYVAMSGNNTRLKIVDVRDPAKPRETASLPLKNITGVTVEGGRVYARVDTRSRGEDDEKGRFRVLDTSDPAKPKFLGAPPTSRTIGYLKRRARRLLWKLAQENPALYADLAAHLIEGNGAALDYETRWLSVDALLGGGRRFTQRRHGRAGYELTQPRFVFKRREERFSSVWDAHPNAARHLWQSESAPVEAREMALKILRAGRQEIPVMAPNRLEELLRSNSPTLQSYAVRALWQHVQNGGALNGATAALALLAAPGKLRAGFEAWTQNARWNKDERRAFGAQLQRAVAQTRPDGKAISWRRRNFAAKLLASAWSEFLDQNAMIENLAFWLGIGDAALDARVLELLRKAGAARGEELQNYVSALARETASLGEAQRERVLQAFLAGVAGRQLGKEEAFGLVSQVGAPARLGWRVLDNAGLQSTVQEELWKFLLCGEASSDAMSVAVSDAFALRVFEKAKPLIADKIRNWAYGSEALWALASPEFFAILLDMVPSEDRARMMFRALARTKSEWAEILWQRFAGLAAGFHPSRVDFQKALFYGYQETGPGARAWDFLGASLASSASLRGFWDNIFSQTGWRQDKQPFTHAAAPGLLRRAGFSAEELTAYLQSYPFILENASPEFYLAILEIVPGEMRLKMLVEASPERWQAAREALLLSLNEASARSAFWQAIWEKLSGDASELQERLLGDEVIVSTFERIEAPAFEAFLKTDSPAHEPWILRWLRAHKPERGEEILLLAATHNLPGVRKWALGRAEYLRLDLPTALRFLEADLPECIASGRKFFEALPIGADDEMDYALALCDSPGYAARGFGREFIESRRQTLFSGALLARLAQHSSPDMQAWLAEKLLDNAAPTQATQPFDRAVLRARGRARKAKNLVQTRHESKNEPAPDTATLLEIARSRTRRDADWALRQLAQKALSGEKIEGVEVVQ